MFKNTYIKTPKKLLKQVKSDLDAIIGFEKTMKTALEDKRIPVDVQKKLKSSIGLMAGAENNTKKIRREILELLRDSKNIIKE